MNIGFFITARLGSTRLGKKHLLTVNNHPILFFLIKRIKEEFQEELIKEKIKIIIVTSDEPENREFKNFQKDGATVFYGSINNIPLRHLQAAKAHSLDSIISIDGDDILCSVKGMRAVYEALMQGAKYAKTLNLPFGMNSSGYSKNFLESSLNGHFDDILETGWGRIFDQSQLTEIQVPFPVQDNVLRFTLDYDEDYQFFKSVIEAFGDDIFSVQDQDIVSLVMNRELYLINESISKQYWDNFYKLQEEESKDIRYDS